MNKQFWKKTAAGLMALLIVAGGVPVQPFAQVFDRALYNEMRPELADAARHNFAALGLSNVTVSCAELAAGKLPLILGSFHPDILFLDPARRASDGRKVFRLEDCQPDVLQLLPELLSACPLVLLKLSPMADISLVCKQLGCVKAVHVVGAEGECKELLLLLERGYHGPHTLTVYSSGAVAEVSAPSGETPDLVGGDGGVMPDPFHVMPDPDRASQAWLFDPGKALLKAGAFTWPCQFGVQKLGLHTHAYVSARPVDALRPFGKWYQILEIAPLNNRSVKEMGKKYPRAEVTARNLPLTSDQLRAKLGIKSGGAVHIFGLHTDTQSANLIFVCTA